MRTPLKAHLKIAFALVCMLLFAGCAPALHSAAQKGDILKVNQLIAEGADINAIDRSGMTPLLLAAMWGKGEVANTLIKAGADINAKDKFNATPLHGAAINGNTEIAVALIKAGADINAKADGDWTPLWYATSRAEQKQSSHSSRQERM